MTKGTNLIAAERDRQISEEGYDAAHDVGHAADLISAAREYAAQARFHVWHGDAEVLTPHAQQEWPWHSSYWKPSGTARRDLVRAGALIAAAIDALPDDAVPGGAS